MVDDLNLVGKTLGGYQIVEEIGRGGMAVVYRAWQPSLERHVAVKVLPPQFTFDTRFVRRFQQEAKTAAGLQHPNIVTIYDVGEQDGIYYIAMNYIQGQPLNQLVHEQGPLPLERAVHIAQQVASALDYAHARGLVHRDVKPANILVGPGDQVTLTDFGLVKAMSGASLTRTGMMMGTPAYMSPEQARGEKVGPEADVYALGVVVYEMLTGRAPFGGDTPALLLAHAYHTPAPIQQLGRQLPPGVDQVLQKALAKDPGQRFRTAGEMVAALASGAGVEQGARTPLPLEGPTKVDLAPAILPVSTQTPVPPRTRRSLVWVLAVLGVSAVVLIGLLAWLRLGVGKDNPEPPLATQASAIITPVPNTATEAEQRTKVPPTVSLQAEPATSAVVASKDSPTPTWTVTHPPIDTSTATFTVTPIPTQVPTQPPTATWTPEATWTPRASETPSPTTAPPSPSPVPTKKPVLSPTPLLVPELVHPADGQTFSSSDEVVLAWQPVGQLPDDACYAISLAYTNQGRSWYDETPCTKRSEWLMSEHRYLLDLSDDGLYQWSVQVVRGTGPALSPMSPTRTLTWTAPGSGGGGDEGPDH